MTFETRERSTQERLHRRDLLKTGTGLSVVAALTLQACGGAGASEVKSEERDKGFPSFFADAPTLTVR
ncbi:MAG: hypothetical protein ACTS5V_04770, partial [Giesbergeria sp.]